MHIIQVLLTLQKENLLLKLKKCEFSMQSLVFLGHVIGYGKLKIDPYKVSVPIVDWPKPYNIIEVRIFLGVVHYLRKFIVDFSHIALALHDVTNNR